ncbi:MAG: hypothetical protein ACRCVW_03800 [Brevinema sp.]
MQKLNPKIQELKDQGHKILSLKCHDLYFLFKQPTIVEISYHEDQLYKSDTIFRLRDKFIRQMFVGDNISEFDKFMTEKPLAHGMIYNLICQELGENINFTIAKV